MKRLLIAFLFILTPAIALAANPVTYPINGGTGSTTLTGILIGNGTSSVRTLIIGSNLTLTGTTLSATGGGGGSGIGDPFTHASYLGQTTSATSTLLQLTASPWSLAASSSLFSNATTTLQSISGSLWLNALASGELTVDANGLVYKGATTTFSAPAVYNPATGAVTITRSGTGADGYLAQGDFQTFNNKISSSSLSVTTVGTSGAATYTPSTGVFNIPQYQAAGNYLTGYNAFTNPTATSFSTTSGIVINNASSTIVGNLNITGNSTTSNATTTSLEVGQTASTTNLIVSSLGSITTKNVCALQSGSLTTTGCNNGTVISLAIATANGFAGSVSGSSGLTATLTTTVTGILKGDGTAISAATAGVDYLASDPNWSFNVGGASISPTSSLNGIFVTASSTLAAFKSTNGTTTNATSTSLEVAQTASTTNLIVSSAGGVAGCATFSVNGTISNTNTACGGSGAAYPFTPSTFGINVSATSTPILDYPGLIAATSTIGALTASSSITNQSVKSALVLNSAAGLEGAYAGSNPCTNQVALSISATGVISCTSVTDAMLSSTFLKSYDAWTHPAAGTSATTSGIVINAASSTIVGNLNITGNSTSTNATTTSEKTTNLTIGSLSGLALLTSGVVSAYGGSANCTNQVINGISSVGAGNCVSVTNAMLSNSSITINNGNGISGGGAVSLGSSLTLTNTDFRWISNFGTTTAATGSPMFFTSGLQASSTSQFSNSSTSVATFATATTTNLIVSSAGGVGTRCAQFAVDGTISAASAACGTTSGTVTSVATSNGIQGGTITNSGTLSLISYLATSSAETATRIPAWASTGGTPATLSGGFAGYTLTATGMVFTYASSTALTATNFFNTYASSTALSLTNFNASGNASSTFASTTALSATNITFGGQLFGNDTATSYTGIVSPVNRLTLQTGTTTSWQATTTGAYIATVVAPFAGTIKDALCSTDSSFLGIDLYVASTHLTYFIASTTVGTENFTSSNTFTKGQLLNMSAGTTTTSGAKTVSCTLDIVQTL